MLVQLITFSDSFSCPIRNVPCVKYSQNKFMGFSCYFFILYLNLVIVPIFESKSLKCHTLISCKKHIFLYVLCHLRIPISLCVSLIDVSPEMPSCKSNTSSYTPIVNRCCLRQPNSTNNTFPSLLSD